MLDPVLSAIIGATGTFAVAASLTTEDGRNRFLNHMRIDPDIPMDLMRQTFNNQVLVTTRPQRNHSHPIAACNRNNANNFIRVYAQMTGHTVYDVGLSRANDRRGVLGRNDYSDAKAMFSRYHVDIIPRNPLYSFVDQVQHVDLPAWLDGSPAVAYVFVPTAACRSHDGDGPETSYCFNTDNTVTYRVSGGAVYREEVWDLSRDVVSVCQRFLGVPYRLTVYSLERKQVDADHQLIAFVPGVRYRFLAAVVASWIGKQPPLQRLKPVAPDGSVALLMTGPNGLEYSLGRAGSYSCANVAARTVHGIVDISNNNKLPLTQATVESALEPTPDPNDRRFTAAAILSYIKNNCPLSAACPITDAAAAATKEAPRMTAYCHSALDIEAKPLVTAFMAPYATGGMVPLNCPSVEREAVHGRITSAKATPQPVVTPAFLDIAQEFVNQLIPVAHIGHPHSWEQIEAAQDTPAKKARFGVAMTTILDGPPVGQAFLKGESYGGIKPARWITPLRNPRDGFDMSRYSHAYAEFLKNVPWYAFRYTPDEIATRVAAMCSTARGEAEEEDRCFTMSDLNKMDGSVSEVCRTLERMILLRFFDPVYHTEVIELHERQMFAVVKGPNVSWDQQTVRNSAEPWTGSFNSSLNACMYYTALRSKYIRRCASHKEAVARAWSAMQSCVIVGGDDGGATGAVVADIDRACAMFGFKATAERITAGCMGVSFLSRVFGPEVWYGDVNTCASVKRTLIKFHLTGNLPDTVTPIQKLLEKSLGLLSSDSETPILGPLCKRARELCLQDGYNASDSAVVQAATRSWFSFTHPEHGWPNTYAEWMDDYVDDVMPGFDHEGLERFLSHATNALMLLESPGFWEAPPPKAPDAARPAAVVVTTGSAGGVDAEYVGDGSHVYDGYVAPKKAKRNKRAGNAINVSTDVDGNANVTTADGDVVARVNAAIADSERCAVVDRIVASALSSASPPVSVGPAVTVYSASSSSSWDYGKYRPRTNTTPKAKSKLSPPPTVVAGADLPRPRRLSRAAQRALDIRFVPKPLTQPGGGDSPVGAHDSTVVTVEHPPTNPPHLGPKIYESFPHDDEMLRMKANLDALDDRQRTRMLEEDRHRWDLAQQQMVAISRGPHAPTAPLQHPYGPRPVAPSARFYPQHYDWAPHLATTRTRDEQASAAGAKSTPGRLNCTPTDTEIREMKRNITRLSDQQAEALLRIDQQRWDKVQADVERNVREFEVITALATDPDVASAVAENARQYLARFPSRPRATNPMGFRPCTLTDKYYENVSMWSARKERDDLLCTALESLRLDPMEDVDAAQQIVDNYATPTSAPVATPAQDKSRKQARRPSSQRQLAGS